MIYSGQAGDKARSHADPLRWEDIWKLFIRRRLAAAGCGEGPKALGPPPPYEQRPNVLPA